MAPHLGRFTLAAALACAAVAAAYLPPPEDAAFLLGPASRRVRTVQRLPEERTRDRIGRHLNYAYRTLRWTELKPLAIRELRARPLNPGAPPRVAATAGVTSETRRNLEAGFRESWTELGRPAEVGLLVIAFSDSVYDPRRGGRRYTTFGAATRYLPPEAVDARACVVLFGRKWGGPNPVGPCRVYARFGLPGPHVSAWLRARGFDVTREDIALGPGLPRPAGLDSILLAFFAPMSGESRLEFVSTSVLGARCGVGDVAACRRAMLDTTNSESRVTSWWVTGPFHFQGMEALFVADLIRRTSPERFQRFWSSPEPVEQAFAAAFGTDIGTWTERWVVSYVGRVRAGSSVSFRSILVTALLIVAVVAGSAASVARKQIEEPDPLGKRLGLTAS